MSLAALARDPTPSGTPSVSQSSLDDAFAAASPRATCVPTPWTSVAIHALVALLWAGLCVAALGAHGLWVWSMGLVYVLYDTGLQVVTMRATWRLMWRRPPAPVVPMSKRYSLGVLVAAHNEAMVLPATIAGLLDQSRPPDQIVIADDGSSDATAQVLGARYGLVAPALGELSQASPVVPTLYWLRLPHGGKARALNAAIVCLDTDLVLTVDADTLLEAEALSAMSCAFELDPRLVAATGVLTPVCDSGWMGRAMQWFQTYEYVRNFLSRYAWMKLDGLLLISGAFAAFRRQALVDVGGFDPRSLVEDYEVVHRLRRYSAQRGLAWTTQVIGRARATTEAPSTLRSFVRQRRRWFGGFLQTQFWYRDMVGNATYGTVGTRMLPIKAMDTLQPLFGLTSLSIVLTCLARGRWAVLLPVATVILVKTLLDLAFHLWALRAYRQWVGRSARTAWIWALLAALLEPFSFQILRHLGASMGWLVFLTGRQQWGRQERVVRQA